MDHLTQLAQFTIADAHALLPHWQATMRSEAKSPGTIDTYTHGLCAYLTWCVRAAQRPLSRTSMTAWMSEMLDAGAAPGRARIRQLGVRRFTAWLIATGQIQVDPFAGVKGPKQTQALVTPLTDDELRDLIATCTTPTHRADEPLHHRRDEAIIGLMFETGIRIGETIALHVADVDLDAGRVIIRRGKGGRGRVIPIGRATSGALRAYLTLRERHRCADSPELWLGERGTGFGYDGLSKALRRRAQLAGITGFHPHSSGTPPPIAGSPPAAPNPDSWPLPAGPAPTCSCATPEPVPPNAPFTRPQDSTSVSSSSRTRMAHAAAYLACLCSDVLVEFGRQPRATERRG